MAGDLSTQRAAHLFFSERLQSLEPFTKDDMKAATGWPESTLDTYWSKQFRHIVEPIPGTNHFRVRERFGPYLDWRRFRGLVTQVKAAQREYEATEYTSVVVYEFYMPLAHEAALRSTLDSLFYRDAILPRLRRTGTTKLLRYFERSLLDTDDDKYFERVCKFVASKFGGYSVYHVDGRFRSADLSTVEEAAKQQKLGGRYLVDETTAVTRFVFPCKADEVEGVRFLFQELFINSITQAVDGEDEIWAVESGVNNIVHVWRPKDD
jgi:hypothetical protein